MAESTHLSRDTHGRPKAPIRIVHLGLGNFFRSHPAWFTEHAPDADAWGIAAFSGRSDTNVAELNAQDCLYTLVVQSADTTQEVISSVSAVHTGKDMAAWRAYFSNPEVQIVTSTITEGGYLRNSEGGLDLENPDVKADIESLTADPLGGELKTAPGKFVAGLLARRAADAGKITFVPCDNVVDSGAMTARVISDLAAKVDPSLQSWIDANVGFVTTMVDRITPRPTAADREALAEATGIDDQAAVVTEPFVEWVLMGKFAGERPAWDAAGANIVDDIVPFEHRKLWLLNGSHSLMAYSGPILGRDTVFEAINDPTIFAWVNEWWDEAVTHIPLPAAAVSAYREALVERFKNPSIRHLLAQIAADGSQKIPIRFKPTILAERAAGRMPTGATRAVAAWILHLRGQGAPVNDIRAAEVLPLVEGTPDQAVARVLAWLGINDHHVNEVVLRQMTEIGQA